MNVIKLMGWLLFAGVAWGGGKTPDFLLLQQGRSTKFHVETHKGNLQIDGIEVDLEVMRGAATCYRVTDRLFIVQFRNMQTAGLLLWDAKEKRIRARMIDEYLPSLSPVAQEWLVIERREGEVGFYGVHPTKMDFVKIGQTGLVGGSKGRLFFLEPAPGAPKPEDPGEPDRQTLTMVESGKEPVTMEVDFGDFHPVHADAVRGDSLLLVKTLEGERTENKVPPRYEVACWDLEGKELESLGEVHGIWVKSESPPRKGGGKRPPRWSPVLQIQWLPRDQKRRLSWHHRSYPLHSVNPRTLEITVQEPEESP